MGGGRPRGGRGGLVWCLMFVFERARPSPSRGGREGGEKQRRGSSGQAAGTASHAWRPV